MSQAKARPYPYPALWASAALLAVALLIFYGLLQKYAINIPTIDDYDCGLEFANRIAVAHSLGQKLLIFAATQHNEYKVLVASAVYWLQYAALGHLNFSLTSTIGNLTPIAVAASVWTLLFSRVRSLGLRFVLFCPVLLLIFNLTYSEALDAPMTALQHLPALAFAFASIQLLLRERRASFALACICLVGSALSSTNGMLVVPLGLIILLRQRNWARLGAWLSVAAMLYVLYRFHYHSPQPAPSSFVFQPSPIAALLFWKPVYVLGVIGNAAALFQLPVTYPLGAAILVALIVLWRNGFLKRNPAILYCSAFLILTAMGIAHIRLVSGMQYHGSSRYRMYSLLLLSFLWAGFAERYLLEEGQRMKACVRSTLLYSGVLAMAFAYVLAAAWKSHNFLRLRAEDYQLGMAAYQHPESGVAFPLASQPSADASSPLRIIMQQSIELGTYQPPRYAAPTPDGPPVPLR